MEASLKRMGASRVWSFIAGVLVLASAGVSVHFYNRYEAVQQERAGDAARIRELEGRLALVQTEVSEYKEKLQSAQEIADDLERQRDATERLAMAHAARIQELEEQLETVSRPEPPDGAGLAVETAAVPDTTPEGSDVAANDSGSESVSAAEAGPAAEAEASSTDTTAPVAVASREELERELEEARAEKAELEKRHAALVSGGGVPIGEVRVTTGLTLKGKVLVVNERYAFVVIDLGAGDGIEKGMVLILHRGKKFVGKCQVGKVYNDKAAADLVLDWMKDDVRVGDGVRKF
jgi:TolA-binding protein